MALTKDERKWLDEKFTNLHNRINDMGLEVNRQRDFETKINNLQVEVEKRPTMAQLLTATATSFGLGLSFMGIAVMIFNSMGG